MFQHLLSILKENFPYIRSLKLAVQTLQFNAISAGPGLHLTIVRPMDQVTSRYGDQLSLCELVVGSSHYDALRNAIGNEHAVEMKARSTSFRKFFRHTGPNDDGYWVGYLPDENPLCTLGT